MSPYPRIAWHGKAVTEGELSEYRLVLTGDADEVIETPTGEKDAMGIPAWEAIDYVNENMTAAILRAALGLSVPKIEEAP